MYPAFSRLKLVVGGLVIADRNALCILCLANSCIESHPLAAKPPGDTMSYSGCRGIESPAPDLCGDLTYGFEQQFTAKRGFSEATAPVLLRNPTPYFRNVLVYEPSRNTQALAD